MSTHPTLIILRGLSGSGKTTRAKQLVTEVVDACVCSADDFQTQNGAYRFDPSTLASAHAQCRALAESEMKDGTSLIVIDNTNIQHWQYQPYLNLAEVYGYAVVIECLGNLYDTKLYAWRNVHSVPETAIRKQALKWEP